MNNGQTPIRKRTNWHLWEVVGVLLVASSLFVLFFFPNSLARFFNTMIAEVMPVVVNIFLTGEVGIAIIVSVIFGRLLERLGFTDGLIRLFVPVMKWLHINPSVIIPSAYNILGDINAAGKISAPILVKANATKSEQKIAVATMIQSPQSFATLVLGLIALSVFNIWAFPLILLSIFAPIIVVPFIRERFIGIRKESSLPSCRALHRIQSFWKRFLRRREKGSNFFCSLSSRLLRLSFSLSAC